MKITIGKTYCNNQFSGVWAPQWARYATGEIIVFLNTKEPGLDMGAGFFSPDDSFLDKGWQTYRDVYPTLLRYVDY